MLWAAAIKATAIAMVAGLSGLAIQANPPNESKTSATDAFATISLDGTNPIVVGRYEVTWREWKACYDDSGCNFLPRPGLREADGNFPVTGVNHFDTDEYIRWINAKSGRTYRLPSADEWNVMSDGLSRRQTKKRFDDPRLAWAANYGSMRQVSAKVQPSGSFGMAANGISDLRGNVWEWTSTCAAKGALDVDCPAYFVEGLHEANVSVFIRDPASGGCATGAPPANIGLRLVEG